MPDGNAVFFTSSREGYPTVNTKFFKVSVNGGTPDALPLPFGFVGSISNDGATMTQFLFFLQETAFCDLTKGNFYVIEVNQHPAFLLNEAGEPQRFETYQ